MLKVYVNTDEVKRKDLPQWFLHSHLREIATCETMLDIFELATKGIETLRLVFELPHVIRDTESMNDEDRNLYEYAPEMYQLTLEDHQWALLFHRNPPYPVALKMVKQAYGQSDLLQVLKVLHENYGIVEIYSSDEIVNEVLNDNLELSKEGTFNLMGLYLNAKNKL